MLLRFALSLLCSLMITNAFAEDKASEVQFTRLSKASISKGNLSLYSGAQLDTPASQIPDPSSLNYEYPKLVPVNRSAVNLRPLANSRSSVNSQSLADSLFLESSLPLKSSLSLKSNQGVKTNQTKRVITLVKVDKSKRRMYLLSGEEIVREYRIALGKQPKGHKQFEGDNRTPEGRYLLEYVTEDSNFYRSIHINYPNYQDVLKAQKLGGVAGGDIKIHGLKNGEYRSPLFIQSFDWTNGCIAITNEQLDDFINLVEMGTPIYIEW